MPSAAHVRVDKHPQPQQAATAATAAAEPAPPAASSADAPAATPLRQAIVTVEHKIRNLEKRKLKLESYKQLQTSGRDLNHDQKTAIAKYDEVVQTLEFARDLCKQFVSISTVSEREAKKQARKEALVKSQSELAKVREVLLVQDALTQMGQENIRDDFLYGRNGAAQLTETDLKLLDELYGAVTPKHEPGDSKVFCTQIQGAAEHLLAVVDGKQKEVFGSTYSHIKDVIGKIHESGYFDQLPQEEFVESVDPEHEEVPPPNNPPSSSLELVNHDAIDSIETLTVEPRPQQQPAVQPQPQSQQQQAAEAPLPPAAMVARAALPPGEPPMYYAAPSHPQPQPPPPPQQQAARPLSDVLGAGSFTFLQDSELDAPPPEPIQSQIFTNQSYAAQGPPPPIPMPPHFQGYVPSPMQQPQLSPAQPGVGVVVVEENHHDHQRGPPKQQQPPPPPQQQQPPTSAVPPRPGQPFYANNGYGGGGGGRPRQQQPQQQLQQPQGRGNNGGAPPRHNQ